MIILMVRYNPKTMLIRPAVNLLITVSLAAFMAFAPVTAAATPGSIVWESVYSGRPGDVEAVAGGMALDPQGNLAITGKTAGRDGKTNYVTLRFGPYGLLEWERFYDFSWKDVGRAAVFDDEGNLYVAGYSYNMDNPRDSYSNSYYTDIRVIKYSPKGNRIAETGAYGFGKNCEPYSITVDDDDNVYVVGYAVNPTGAFPLFYTAKFDRTGRMAWDRAEDWGAESCATAVKAEPDGNILVTGWFKDKEGTFSIRTVRYTPDGRMTMDLVYHNRSEDEQAWGIAQDLDGCIYVTGDTNAYGGTALTLKYSPTGELLWASPAKGLDYRTSGHACVVDTAGILYVVGRTIRQAETGIEGDYLLLIYDKAGKLLSSYTYNFGGDCRAEDVVLDVYGNIVITGSDGQSIHTIRVEGLRPTAAKSMRRERLARVFDQAEEFRPDRRFIPDMLQASGLYDRQLLLTLPLAPGLEVEPTVIESGPVRRVEIKARAEGMPNSCEYRFSVQGRGHAWEPVSDYTGVGYFIVEDSLKFKPKKVMVEVRTKGSTLRHEARVEIDLDSLQQ